MGFCTSCGSTMADEARFCDKCGLPAASKSIIETARASTIEVIAPLAATWHVTFATGQTGGQIKITDSVVLSGGSTWVPITQSPFARDIVTQASVDRLAASTCPRCGAAMAVVTKKSAFATILILVGIITSVFIIGVILIIMGVMMRRKGKVAYQCPRCNYRT